MAIGTIKSADDLTAHIKRNGIVRAQIGYTDHTGQLRGKIISTEKLLGGLKKGVAMTRNLAAVDFGDIIFSIEGLTLNGGGFGDSLARIVPESCREIPWEPAESNLFLLIEHCDEAAAYDARVLASRMVEKANAMGFRPYFSCEFEFRVFNETSKSAHEKDFTGLELATPESNYLGVLRQSVWSEFFNNLINDMEHIGIPIEVAHWELAPGFAELVMQYGEGMRAADNAVLFKTFAKASAQRRNMLLSFMARYDANSDGSSCHMHTSLCDMDGNPVFYDPEAEDTISEVMRLFIGGMQRYVPECILMMAPNINSYKRYLPGLFAPVAATWGIDNRTSGFRAIVGQASAQRLENRAPGADVNPYLAFAAMLGAGLRGIEEKIKPTQKSETNLYAEMDSIPKALRFPETLKDAISLFKASSFAKETFGEEFVRIFSDNREAHLADFNSAVTDWERRRYLELT
ncbi:MAG: glutamine synthetase family protein [Sphingomonadaceae bacterium]|jgi:glutamine synthetase|nr:glutamine synthetase family protein [Sphingomonadaceae bacterium]